MTPEEVLTPFIKRFEIPDTLIRLLYLLLQREVETSYKSLSYSTNYDKEDPALRYAQGLNYIFSRLPKIRDLGAGFSSSLYELANFTDADVSYIFSLSTPVLRYFYEEREASLRKEIRDTERFINQVEKGVNVSSEKQWIQQCKADLKEKQPDIVPHLSKFWSDLLSFNVGFELPNRNRHCHILGQSGTGKTSLIKKMVYQDMQTDCSVIVMAPKGNLITTLSRLPCDRTICVQDWSQVGLNLLDLDAGLLAWVFESLLDSEPTPRQKNFLLYCSTKVKNLADFRALLEKKPPDEFKDVPQSIKWRLDPILEAYPVLNGIFSRETNIDILDVMDSGKVLLLDTQSLGELGSSLIGRFIVALISLSVKKRKSKRFVAVYLDEFPQYTTDHIAHMLDTAREANVGLHLAHQNLTQLLKYPALRASVHGSALKFVGACNYSDSVEMAKEMGVEPETLKKQDDLHFTLYGLKKPTQVKIIWDEIDRLATSHAKHFVSESIPTLADVYTPSLEKPKHDW